MNLDKNDYDSNFGDSVVVAAVAAAVAATATAKRLWHLYLIAIKTHVEIERSRKVLASANAKRMHCIIHGKSSKREIPSIICG